jgi:hypothetical protein
MIIDVGTHDSKVLDSSMEEFVKVSHAHLVNPVHMIDISTSPKGEDEEEYFVHFQNISKPDSVPFTASSRAREQVQWSMAVKNAPHIHTEVSLNCHRSSLYV